MPEVSGLLVLERLHAGVRARGDQRPVAIDDKGRSSGTITRTLTVEDLAIDPVNVAAYANVTGLRFDNAVPRDAARPGDPPTQARQFAVLGRPSTGPPSDVDDAGFVSLVRKAIKQREEGAAGFHKTSGRHQRLRRGQRLRPNFDLAGHIRKTIRRNC